MGTCITLVIHWICTSLCSCRAQGLAAELEELRKRLSDFNIVSFGEVAHILPRVKAVQRVFFSKI